MPIKVDSKKCQGCSACVSVCPASVLALKAGKVAVVNAGACLECHACEASCPHGAISF